jgi:L-threonylcarbamoyladenylate synthase
MVQVIKLNPNKPDKAVIQKAREIIAAGRLVIFPTDTVYGLATDPFNEAAVLRLIDAKRRDEAKGFPILVANLEMAKELVKFSSMALSIASKFWPGALTLVLPLRKSMPSIVTGDRQTLGVRVPDHPIARQLAEIPIIGTSANISGRESPLSAEDAINQLGDSVDLVLDTGPTKEGIASTIIDLTTKTPRIIREGAIKKNQLQRYLR